jgi:PAS domain S-box-containing protein
MDEMLDLSTNRIDDRAFLPLKDKQLQILFEATLDAIAIVDDQGVYLDINPATCKLFGLEKNELLGRCISEFVEPEFNFPAVWQQLPQQKKMRGEIRLMRTNGEIRVVEYAATANFLPHCHLSVMRDITDCQRTEAKVQELTRQLLQTEAQLQEASIDFVSPLATAEYHRLEQISRHIPGAIYQFRQRPDGTFHFPYASEGLREISGVAPEEARENAAKVFNVIHSDDFDRVIQSILQSAKHLTPWDCEYRACLPDGRTLWLIGNATPQREPDGSTLWHGYIRDISDRKRVEADSQRLLAILESTSDLIGTIDLTGKALYINRAWRNLLNINNNAAIADMEISKGHPEWALDIILNQGLPEAVSSGSWHGETAILDSTGREIPVSQVILAHKSTDGNVEYFSTTIRDISESKVTELALRISENRFRSIIENLNDMVYIINPDATFSYVSTQFKEVMGYELTELLNRAFAELIYPEDLPICVDAIHRSLQGEKLRGIEYQILHQDGNYYWHSSHLSALRDDNGEVVGCLGIARYIHDRKQAEIENWQTQNFLNSIIENIPNMVFVKEVDDLRFVRFNKAGEELLGYPKEALLGKNDRDFFPAEEADFFIVKDREVLANGKVLDIPEEPIQTNHQGTRILHTKKIPIFDELGNPQYLLGISEDITERKQAETKLNEISERLSFALKSGGIGCWEWDIIQNTLVWDERMYELYGVTKNSDTRLAYDIWTQGLHPEDRDASETLIRQAVLGQAEFDPEFRVIHPDGSIHFIKAFGLVRRDAEGNPQKMIGVNFDISDRKQAETQLNEISERLSLALKSGRIGCWEWDLVHNTLFWDDRMYELYGATKNSDTRLAYNIWANGLHPDDRDAAQTLGQQTILGQAEYDTEFRVIHPDGSIHFIKAFALVRRDAEGNPQKMIGVNFDISERKRAEAELKQAQTELKETEKFLRSIYEGVGSLIFVVDVLENRELIYTGWSLSTEKATGIAAADIIGKTPESIFGLTEGAAVRQNHLRCIESGASIAYEECLTFNEQETWWLTILNPLKNSDNRISRIVGTTINISDRKRQEQALRLIVEGTAAKTGEEFFKSCAQYLAQVLGVRYAAIAEFANPEKSIVQTLAFWAGDDFSNNFTCNLAGTICKNAPCKNISSATEVYRCPNSVKCLFPQDNALVALPTKSYAGLPIIDAAGNRLGLLEVMDTKPMVKDLEMQSAILKIFATRAGAEMERMQGEAALRKSEIQLRQQAEELEITLKKLQNTQIQLIQAEKMSSLGQLVAGVAHEINNPVSFIYGNIQHATDYINDLIELVRLYQKHHPSPSPTISQFVEDIDLEYLIKDFSNLLKSMKLGTTRIQNIVKSLRTFSRLDEADFKEIDLHENIDSTLVILQNRLNGRAGNPEINVTKNYGNLPLVECYGGLLNQVFMNFLVNAIDAIEQEQKRLELIGKLDYNGEIIITTAIVSKNQVSISIQDNGCGMSPEVKAKIFNPFFTTKPIGKGTGMGLAISYQIIEEQHQGKIAVNSAIGAGTEFIIYLSKNMSDVRQEK